MPAELTPEMVSLYAEPPERFIERRTALVSNLKEQGESAAAGAAAKLRRPTVAAWAIDKVARDRPDDVSSLIALGEELAAAQQAADADRIVQLGDERTRSIERLVKLAVQALTAIDAPASRQTLDKIGDTLRAIATDEAAREKVRHGVLDRELDAPAAFGDVRLDAALLASVHDLPVETSKGPSDSRREAARKMREERLSAEAARLDSEAKALEAEAERARKAAERSAQVAASARRRADQAARRARPS